MVKSSTKSILEKKYKPWRKGKSAKAKVKSNIGVIGGGGGRSLKNQLRSKERFLSKLKQHQSNNSNDEGKSKKTLELIEVVTKEIEGLKNEIQTKQNSLRQKKIATK